MRFLKLFSSIFIISSFFYQAFAGCPRNVMVEKKIQGRLQCNQVKYVGDGGLVEMGTEFCQKDRVVHIDRAKNAKRDAMVLMEPNQQGMVKIRYELSKMEKIVHAVELRCDN